MGIDVTIAPVRSEYPGEYCRRLWPLLLHRNGSFLLHCSRFLEETYSHLVMAVRLGYVSEVETKAIFSEIVRLRQMINGYIAFLKRIKSGDKEPDAASQVREPHFDYLFGDSIDETDEDSLFSESPNTENTPEHEGKQD